MLAIHWLFHLSHFHLRGIPSRESESNSRSLNAKFALSKGDGNQEKIPLVCATDGRGTKKKRQYCIKRNGEAGARQRGTGNEGAQAPRSLLPHGSPVAHLDGT